MTLKVSRVCRVDVDGVFKFENYLFKISGEDERYKVTNKVIYDDFYNVLNDYTNESDMDRIKVVLEEGEGITFYDEYGNEIDSELITFIREDY